MGLILDLIGTMDFWTKIANYSLIKVYDSLNKSKAERLQSSPATPTSFRNQSKSLSSIHTRHERFIVMYCARIKLRLNGENDFLRIATPEIIRLHTTYAKMESLTRMRSVAQSDLSIPYMLRKQL